jgi:hypothetical protein
MTTINTVDAARVELLLNSRRLPAGPATAATLSATSAAAGARTCFELVRAHSTLIYGSWTRNGQTVVAMVPNSGGASNDKASKVRFGWSRNGRAGVVAPSKSAIHNCGKSQPPGH